jgi:hypothetical protein
MPDGMTSDAAEDGVSANWLVWAAAGTVLLSALLLSGGVFLHFTGYLLASVVTFTLIAFFRKRSLQHSLSAGIGVSRSVNLVAGGILVVGFLVSIAHSWFIASHFS